MQTIHVPWRRWKLSGAPSKTARDTVVLILLAPLFVYICSELNLFERAYDFSHAHEWLHFQDIVAGVIYLIGAAAFFTTRRYIELKQEMTRRLAEETEARRLARHDPLTGLANRRRLRGEFESRKSRAGPKTELALFVIDLDRFKPINDIHGHPAGDAVLRVIAGRLTDLAGDRGIAARLGGDEFGLLIDCTSDRETVLRLARRLCHEIARPINAKDVTVNVGCSLGIAFYPENARDFETLLRHSDVAMYDAKQDGRGTFHFFSEELERKVAQRMELERDLRNAIKHRRIVPYYHPIVELSTGKTLGYEVLARWQHPKRGVLEPDEFVPIAEDSGMIASMTYSLLEKACRDARDWPKHLVLSLNISPHQLTDPWLPQEVLRILTKTRFPAKRLQIEITENALVEKLDEVKSVLKSLHSQGIKIALDDFGTGYSGLYHLRELDLDSLKIDQSFVRDMLSGREQERIVEAIIGLSNALGLHTTAEGVENAEVHARLSELGCGAGQGFMYGEPIPAEEITHALALDAPQKGKLKRTA